VENINVFDFVVIALIVILGLKGLFRGFIKEIFGIIGIIGGVFVASRVAVDVGKLINDIIPIPNENTITMVGFIVVLVCFWIVAYLLGMILDKVFDLSGLGFFNRILGFFFGAGKIFLLISVIIYSASQIKMVNDKLQPKVKNSVTFPILIESGKYIIKLDIKEMQQKLSTKFQNTSNSIKNSIQNIEKELKVK